MLTCRREHNKKPAQAPDEFSCCQADVAINHPVPRTCVGQGTRSISCMISTFWQQLFPSEKGDRPPMETERAKELANFVSWVGANIKESTESSTGSILIIR